MGTSLARFRFIIKSGALLSLSLLAAGVASGFDSNDQGIRTKHTPYDRFFENVHRVLVHSTGCASFDEVQRLMWEGHAFRYSYSTPYIPQKPECTAQSRTGDCKAKSLWLAEQMHDARVRFVVGKLREGDRKNHMWLIWSEHGKCWLLDPTVEAQPMSAAGIGPRDYVPLFSYTVGGPLVHLAALREKSDSATPLSIVAPARPLSRTRPLRPLSPLPALP